MDITEDLNVLSELLDDVTLQEAMAEDALVNTGGEVTPDVAATRRAVGIWRAA